ncbi:hypothetical protein P3W45_001303 [Vairimorpha bombi]|jgi:TBC1 domain family member 2
MKNKSRIEKILSHRIIDEIYLRKKIKKYKQFYCTRIFDIFLDTDYDTKKEYETLYRLSTLSADKFYIQNYIKNSEKKTGIDFLEYIKKEEKCKKNNTDDIKKNTGKEYNVKNESQDLNNKEQIISTDKKCNTFGLFYNKLDINRKTIHQIHIDIKRLSDLYKKSGNTDVTYIYYNILVLISHRRFKLGYVQGMADFLVPLVHEYSKEDIQTSENKAYYAYLEIIRRVEFNIINLQGNLILRLREELENIDPNLYAYLQNIRLDFHIFSFRWFNCLFFREFQYSEYLRIFTVILAYKDINRILLYIAVGILTILRKEIFKLDYNGIVLMIQDLFNRKWEEGEIDEILNRANVLYKMRK